VARKSKQAVVAEFRSAEILEAARRVFARKGFAAASVEDIADAAGLAKATVYHYFPSKRKLYRAALEQNIEGLIQQMRREVDAARGTAAKIRAFLAARLRYAETHGEIVCRSESVAAEPLCFNKDFKDLCRRQVEVLEAVLEEGQARGEIRAVPAAGAAFLACELTRALMSRRLRGWSSRSVEGEIDFLFDLIWKGLAVNGRTVSGGAPCVAH
jgi:AcrR family transcriptional regulator